MAKYTFQSPDYEDVIVDAPEGHSREQARQYLKKQWESGQFEPTPKEKKAQAIYDPMGAYAGEGTQEMVSGTAPKGFAGGYAKGAVSIPLGLAGEVESLGRAGLRAAGAPVSKESFLPTVERTQELLFGKPKTEGEKFGREMGAIVGVPFAGAALRAAPGVAKAGIAAAKELPSAVKAAGETAGKVITTPAKAAARGILGETTPAIQRLSKLGEDRGFKYSPAQLRSVEPISQRGATFEAKSNQELANRLVTRETGEEVKNIDHTFIGDRFKDLGKKFDNVYKGKVFNIDKDAVNAINMINELETKLPSFAGTTPVYEATQNIINNFNRLSKREGAAPNTFGIQGEYLQKLRNALTDRARRSGSGDAREIYNLIDVIDSSIQRNHKDVAAILGKIRPQYRATIILEDLYKQGGIRQGNTSLQRMGDMLKNDRSFFRREPSEIDMLGQIGYETKLAALWEPSASKEIGRVVENLAIPSKTSLSSILGTAIPVVPALRSKTARSIQKWASEQAPSAEKAIQKAKD
ncbi:MAG: hypothetical protein EBR82_11975 [Caulobacteraceae bacterium]|nr:hypothetical protein [Caulobacteraceae bacterium]